MDMILLRMLADAVAQVHLCRFRSSSECEFDWHDLTCVMLPWSFNSVAYDLTLDVDETLLLYVGLQQCLPSLRASNVIARVGVQLRRCRNPKSNRNSLDAAVSAGSLAR